MKYDNSCDLYIASLWRGGHCSETINSLINQKELASLTVVCNNYSDEQFAWLISRCHSTKIKLIRGANEKGSNEKLRYISDGKAQFLGFADDDLIYPKNYLENMIVGVMKYDGLVSLHGSRLTKLPIKNYYKDRLVYKCLGFVPDDTEVDVIGTGVSLIARVKLPQQEWENLYKNACATSMDDILLSMLAARYGIKRYVLQHPENYLVHKEQFEEDKYVFDEYRSKNFDCPVQTNFVNSNYFDLVEVKSHLDDEHLKINKADPISRLIFKNDEVLLDLLMKGEDEKSINCIEDLILSNPGDPYLYYLKGLLHQKRNQFFDAINCYCVSLQLDSKLIFVFESLADVQMRLAFLDDALLSVNAAISLSPDNVINQNRLSIICIKLGKFQEAYKAARHSLSLDSKNTHSFLLLGIACAGLNNFCDDFSELDKIIDIPFDFLGSIKRIPGRSL